MPLKSTNAVVILPPTVRTVRTCVSSKNLHEYETICATLGIFEIAVALEPYPCLNVLWGTHPAPVWARPGGVQQGGLGSTPTVGGNGPGSRSPCSPSSPSNPARIVVAIPPSYLQKRGCGSTAPIPPHPSPSR